MSGALAVSKSMSKVARKKFYLFTSGVVYMIQVSQSTEVVQTFFFDNACQNLPGPTNVDTTVEPNQICTTIKQLQQELLK